jgi:hypothetical protein
MIFQICCWHFQVLNSRWFWFCNFLKLGACVTTCYLFVSRNGEWAEEAIEFFGRLCHRAQLTVLVSLLDYDKERKQGGIRRALSVIELYDTSVTQVCYCHSFLVPYYRFFVCILSLLWLSRWLDDQGISVQLLTRLEILIFSTVFRQAFETHTASYPVDCGLPVNMCKAVRVWSWPLISI